MSRLSSAARKTLGKLRGTAPRRRTGRGPLEAQLHGDPDDPRTKLAQARLEKEGALAERYQILNAVHRGELAEVKVLEAGYARAAGALRRGLEALGRRFGQDARDLVEDTLRAMDEEIARTFERAAQRGR